MSLIAPKPPPFVAPPLAAARSATLASLLPPDWAKALEGELKKPYFKDLERFLAEERTKQTVFPAPQQVFAALWRTPLSKVKVVLLGQDPYPTRGNANGLSFSVPAGRAIPASLKNMLQVAEKDVGAKVPNNGVLVPWADQGVLLLNTVLTVREGQANSHKGKGWEQFTRAILEQVNQQDRRVVFFLLGKQAEEVVGRRVDLSKHAVVAAPHPSPLNIGNPFARSRPFSRVNQALREGRRRPINWKLPNLPS